MWCFLGRDRQTDAMETEEFEGSLSGSRALRAVGWTGIALGVTALGLYVGRELRQRYKFTHRTPMDYFSHAGEEMGTEFGVGV